MFCFSSFYLPNYDVFLQSHYYLKCNIMVRLRNLEKLWWPFQVLNVKFHNFLDKNRVYFYKYDLQATW